MSFPPELKVLIIKKACHLELYDYFEYKKQKNQKRKLMFSLLVNSHCCCCGAVLPIFNNKFYGSEGQFYDRNFYYFGKFCSKYCWRRLDDYWWEYGNYPPQHQVCSGTEGEGFFENLNEKYSDIWIDNQIDIGIKLLNKRK